MPKIDNGKRLKRALDGILKKALEEISTQVRDEIHEYLLVDFYMRLEYTPTKESYERTYELLQSITASIVENKKGVLNVDVYFDISKINAYENVNGWNSHMSLNGDDFYEDRPISSWLIEWIEEGNSGTMGNNPIKGIHMLKETSQWTNENLDRIIKSIFGRYGLKLKLLPKTN